jgi:DnaJ-class molecular chaperone
MPSKKKEDDLAAEPPTTINPYRTLDVPRDATTEQIKAAYRKAALKHHPGEYFFPLLFAIQFHLSSH